MSFTAQSMGALAALAALVALCPIPAHGQADERVCSQDRDWMNRRLPVQERVDLLMDCMTVEEMAGQCVMAYSEPLFRQPEFGQMALGGLLPGAGGHPARDEGGNTAGSWLARSVWFQEESVCRTPLGIPVLYSEDAVHGMAHIQGGVVFPHNIGLGAMCAGKTGAELAECAEVMIDVGEATQEEVTAVGHHWNFAPTICVTEDVRWGRTYECYSEDAEVVAAMSVIIEGYRKSGTMIATAKHFLGDGLVEEGTGQFSLLDKGITPVRKLARAKIPFMDAINRHGVDTVMASYSGVDASQGDSTRMVAADTKLLETFNRKLRETLNANTKLLEALASNPSTIPLLHCSCALL
ncbi:unnamed protein product [Chrysoparadoxa australica]